MSLLHDQGIKHTSYVTIFADRLVENIDGLIKDTTRKKIIVYLQQDVSKTMYNSCDSPNIYEQTEGRCYTNTWHHSNSEK